MRCYRCGNNWASPRSSARTIQTTRGSKRASRQLARGSPCPRPLVALVITHAVGLAGHGQRRLESHLVARIRSPLRRRRLHNACTGGLTHTLTLTHPEPHPGASTVPLPQPGACRLGGFRDQSRDQHLSDRQGWGTPRARCRDGPGPDRLPAFRRPTGPPRPHLIPNADRFCIFDCVPLFFNLINA